MALWRAGRKLGARTSDALWAAAVGVVEGMGCGARDLRVDYVRLKKRFKRGVSLSPAMADDEEVRLMEVFAAPTMARLAGCIIEMENVQGAKMRIGLNILDGLTGLSSAFWSARQNCTCS